MQVFFRLPTTRYIVWYAVHCIKRWKKKKLCYGTTNLKSTTTATAKTNGVQLPSHINMWTKTKWLKVWQNVCVKDFAVKIWALTTDARCLSAWWKRPPFFKSLHLNFFALFLYRFDIYKWCVHSIRLDFGSFARSLVALADSFASRHTW